MYCSMKTTLALFIKRIQGNLILKRQLNCWTADITKKHRKIYEKTYPAVLVHPDGSTVNIQYFEPRKIIKLPLDITTLSELDRKLILESRKPKTKVEIEDEVEDNFDENKYLKIAKM